MCQQVYSELLLACLIFCSFTQDLAQAKLDMHCCFTPVAETAAEIAVHQFCFTWHAAKCTGAPKLQTTVLTQEYMKSRAVFIAQLVQKQDVTISVDCWRSKRNQPVYACNVAYSDGTVFLLGAKELSGAADTAENIAGQETDMADFSLTCFHQLVQNIWWMSTVPAFPSGLVRDWIAMLGPEKVGSLCTDDTSTLKTARRLVVAAEGFTHIVDHR